MGHFSNTMYNDVVGSILETQQKALNNNYYKYSDKPPTPVEYFHLNKEASSLDEGSKLAYNTVGDNSPFKYNLIHNMMVYGFEQIQIQYANEDFGTESAAIEGDVVILPNTIEPYPDDQFCITYLKRQIVFKVTHVEPDTLEDGSNIYKITYRSSTSKIESLKEQVIEEFDFIINNVGTELNPIIKSSSVEFGKVIERTAILLKQYYKRLFYNKRVQTFTYRFLEQNFYDPYMIEFIRKNKLLEGDGEYVYVQHQTQLEPMFPMIYSKSMFSCIEKKDPVHIDSYTHDAIGHLITNDFTIFVNRMEDYWEVKYDYPQGYEFSQLIPCFHTVFVNHTAEEKLIESKKYSFYNIIIKYLYDMDITVDDIKELENIAFDNCPMLFYAIPCIIYCLERYLDKLIRINK